MRVRVIDLPTSGELGEFQRKTAEAVKSLTDAVNGGLEFGLNVQTSLVTVEFIANNANTKASHGLGKKPTGYLVAGTTAAMQVYDGTGENTDKDIYLRASATGTARVLVF